MAKLYYNEHSNKTCFIMKVDHLYNKLLDTLGYELDAAQGECMKLILKILCGVMESKNKNNKLYKLWIKTIALFNKRQYSTNKYGLYIHGKVGRGKTMIVSHCLKNYPNLKYRKLHFHKFMNQLHDILNKSNSKDSGRARITKPLMQLIGDIDLLFIDEFSINNIADAMLVAPIFDILQEKGIFVITSSNIPPDQLYKNGLQYSRVLPFIKYLMSSFITYELEALYDYRLKQINQIKDHYSFESFSRRQDFIDKLINDLAIDSFAVTNVRVNSARSLQLIKTHGQLAFMTFAELCKTPKGAADYYAICYQFPTIIIEEVEPMEDDETLLRFITLIDCIYDNHNCLIATFQTSLEKLYTGTKYKIEWSRALSRLHHLRYGRNDAAQD